MADKTMKEIKDLYGAIAKVYKAFSDHPEYPHHIIDVWKPPMVNRPGGGDDDTGACCYHSVDSETPWYCENYPNAPGCGDVNKCKDGTYKQCMDRRTGKFYSGLTCEQIVGTHLCPQP